MFRVFTNDPDNAFPMNNFALIANFLYWWTNFHYFVPLQIAAARAAWFWNFKSRIRDLFIPICNSTAIQVIWRKLDKNFIARQNSYKIFPHFAWNMRQNLMSVVFDFNFEHRVRQGFKHGCRNLYRFFFWHILQSQLCHSWQTVYVTFFFFVFQVKPGQFQF